MYIKKSSVAGKIFNYDIPNSYFKPKYVIIGFQKNRNENITIDNGLIYIILKIFKFI